MRAPALTELQVDALLDWLFTNGAGDKADRLVLTQDLAGGKRDLGGWSREAIRFKLRMLEFQGKET